MATQEFSLHFLVVGILLLISPSLSVCQVVPVNVAAASNNATCSASQPQDNSHRVNDRPCSNAIDGLEYSASSRWSFAGTPVGTWLAITFARAYSISAVQIMPLRTENTFKDISLEFDDTNVNVTLTPEADDNQEWSNFGISPPTVSRTVKLTILSAYDTSMRFNGLTEVRVYGTLPVKRDMCSSNPCQNRATCSISQTGSYTCHCAARFSGDNCETDLDECSSSPCQHDATCSTPQFGVYSCECLPGYSGDNCETEVSPSTTETRTSESSDRGGNVDVSLSTTQIRATSEHPDCSGNVEDDSGTITPVALVGAIVASLFVGVLSGVLLGFVRWGRRDAAANKSGSPTELPDMHIASNDDNAQYEQLAEGHSSGDVRNQGIYVGIENSTADRGESPYAEVAETDQSQRHYVNARRV